MSAGVSQDRSMLDVASPRWVNWAGNQEVYPNHILRPRNLEELRQVVAEVTSRKGRMRAVATGLSFSDILQTDDTLVVLTDLKPVDGPLLALEDDLFTAPPTVPMVRVVCGARIREVNEALAKAGLGCVNLGGYDGQTMIGAISTSTHGSGIGLGPLSNLVRSLDLVTTGGKIYRIEPSNGPTDSDRFTRRYGEGRELKKNDDWFQSVVVSMGCMGVIHSVLLEVRAAYRLIEHRRIAPWSEVKREIATKIREHRHYEISINPYRLRGKNDHDCLVTERDVAPMDAPTIPLPAGRRAAETLVFLPSTERALAQIMDGAPRFLPTILTTGMDALKTEAAGHIDDSYKVFNLNKINGSQVLSGEYFFPLADDAYQLAVTRILYVIEQNQRRGVYATTPLSLRFVASANAYLSMTEGREYCSMEISAHTAVHGAHEALLCYEQVCCELGGRPHWGQLNELTGTRGFLGAAYPKADKWKQAFRELNSAGIFDNHFTDRLGLSTGARP